MATKRTGLGRGLEALLPQIENDDNVIVQELDINLIDPNPEQPRKAFDKEALFQLSQSIKENGLLSPILVVENGSRYSIIAGERRFRAARLAGLTQISSIIRKITHDKQLEFALIENLQREELNPIEEAVAINNLMKEFNYTQDEIAKKISKSRSAIANTLRLLQLPQDIIDMVTNNELTAGHARVLVSVEDEEKQFLLAEQCILHGHSVRKLEQLAKTINTVSPEKKAVVIPELLTLQNAFREALGVKISVSGNEKKGKIILNYASTSELEHLYDSIEKLKK